MYTQGHSLLSFSIIGTYYMNDDQEKQSPWSLVYF